jgi:HAD superfamily hydrolase (TIGR01549 family)
MSPRIEAILFDIDGTLVDSVDFHAEAWQRAFAHFGKQIPFRDVRQQIGKGGDQLMPVFLSKEQLGRFGEDLEKYRGDLYKREYLPRVQAFPGVRPLFERLMRDGVRIGLASSAHGDELQEYKRIANIDDLVRAETSADDADRSKPHPDIFVAALETVGNPPPATVLVVGDTPYDAEAAVKAGLGTIGVRCGGFPDAQLRGAGCIALYDDPQDLLAAYTDSPICRPVASFRLGLI